MNWLIRKVFFSKLFNNVRRGYYVDAYYQGKTDQMFNMHLKGLDEK